MKSEINNIIFAHLKEHLNEEFFKKFKSAKELEDCVEDLKKILLCQLKNYNINCNNGATSSSFRGKDVTVTSSTSASEANIEEGEPEEKYVLNETVSNHEVRSTRNSQPFHDTHSSHSKKQTRKKNMKKYKNDILKEEIEQICSREKFLEFYQNKEENWTSTIEETEYPASEFSLLVSYLLQEDKRDDLDLFCSNSMNLWSTMQNVIWEKNPTLKNYKGICLLQKALNSKNISYLEIMKLFKQRFDSAVILNRGHPIKSNFKPNSRLDCRIRLGAYIKNIPFFGEWIKTWCLNEKTINNFSREELQHVIKQLKKISFNTDRLNNCRIIPKHEEILNKGMHYPPNPTPPPFI